VPDFFSQMGPFLRSVLPIGGWRGSELPNLKPWVKAVFAVYVLLVVPVLAILLFFLITYTPSIVVSIWDSSLTQAGRFSVALSEGSVLGMAAALSQYALLAIEIVGIVYLFYALGRLALKALWNWLNQRPRTA